MHNNIHTLSTIRSSNLPECCHGCYGQKQLVKETAAAVDSCYGQKQLVKETAAAVDMHKRNSYFSAVCR